MPRISKLERGQQSKEYFFAPMQQIQSTVSPTIPKQKNLGITKIIKTIQELT